jgi:RimJ/RimL family protein N-acetyltransferase
VRIREAEPRDAAALITLFEKLYAETDFLLYEPGEWTSTEAEQARHLEESSRTGGRATFVCEADGELIGVTFGNRGSARRTRHSLHIVIGVLQAWVGRGIGRALLDALEAWARVRGLHRLELTVAVTNRRAIALYDKCGFEREGVKRHSHRIDGKYVDSLYMSKLIDTQRLTPAGATTGAG